jgi:diketogulonate reductase-like aldo/keto reductase
MATVAVRSIQLPSGATIPALGQGAWRMGEGRHPTHEEITALRLGLDLGMTLIDTAEMYGDGASEQLVGAAIAGRRGEVFLVSKVLPQHATRGGTVAACERSLWRLGVDYLDLYLLHWRGPVPLAETVAGFEELVRRGLIRAWGVSNFDLGVEHRRPIMAYSPIEQGRLPAHPAVRAIAERLGATPGQVALAWVLRHEGVVAIPKAATPRHVTENRRALDLRLSAADLAELDQAFPPPSGPQPLAML